MPFQVLNPLTYPGWDDLLRSTPGASFFHSAPWARVLAESYGYRPHYFAFSGNGRFKILVPMMEVCSPLTGKRGVSLPFTDYCDPLLEPEVPFPELFLGVIEHGRNRGWKYIEIRGGDRIVPRPLSPAPGFPTSGGLYPLAGGRKTGIPPVAFSPSTSYFVHRLTLSKGEEHLTKRFRGSTRRNMLKACSEGVKIEILRTSSGVGEFFRLNQLTRRNHGLPPQPLQFFKRIEEHVISRNMGFVALAYYGQKAIAGGVFFYFQGEGIYKYGASDRKYQHLRANNLVIGEAIKWFCDNDFKTFCFGRTERDNTGLRQFKSGWGAEESTLHYFKYDLRKNGFAVDPVRKHGIYTRLFQRMPIPVLNLLGSLLYKHMG